MPGKPTTFLATGAAELEPTFSPDGKWIAYASTEAGRAEIYVRPFPGPGGKRLRLARLERIRVVPYGIEGDSFRASKPQPWSDVRFVPRQRQRSVDLHPDGNRFAIAAAGAAQTKQDKVVLILNFFDELTRVGAGARR